MAYENPGKTISLMATEAMAKRYIAVSLVSGVNEGIKIATGSDPVVGVLQMDAREGQISTVMIDGISFIEAAGPIPAASPIKATTGGLGTTGIAADRFGYALNAATAAGDIISVLLK